MPNYARLDGANTVIETWAHDDLTPDLIHEPSIAAQFVPCPDEVAQRWTHDPVADTWTAPPPVAPPPVRLALIPAGMFYMSFTAQEMIAIKTSQDALVGEFYARYDIARKEGMLIDPNLISTQEGLEYLQAVGILANSSRITEIMNGVPK